MTRSFLLLFAFFASAGVTQAQSLVVSDHATSKTFTAVQLLADKVTRSVEIADPVYKRTMTYRAIAMVDLMRDFKSESDDYVQARAVDDFSVAIPASLLKKDAFLAIEIAAASWPKLPGGTKSAGPFYIVWQSRSDPGISSEYWVYHWLRSPSPTVRPNGGRASPSAPMCPPPILPAAASTASWRSAWLATFSTVRAREGRGPTSRGR